MVSGGADNNLVKEPIVYVALGDSLTAGVGLSNYNDSFPYLLARRFGKSDQAVTLKDRATPGTKTEDLLDKLLPLAIKDGPDIVTVLIGINDIHGIISADNFKNNYDRILSRLTKETSAKIYVINLPFIGADTLVLPPYNYLLDARTKEFNKIIKQLANKYSVSYIDLYTPTVALFKTSGAHYSVDLFHPSATGYKIWADIIYDNINK
ncbi:MAG: SGNH/GDSL hydrolase family protein [Patescibacteria group bacterium]|jgi:lysophospholipase L1-like esterase